MMTARVKALVSVAAIASAIACGESGAVNGPLVPCSTAVSSANPATDVSGVPSPTPVVPGPMPTISPTPTVTPMPTVSPMPTTPMPSEPAPTTEPPPPVDDPQADAGMPMQEPDAAVATPAESPPCPSGWTCEDPAAGLAAFGLQGTVTDTDGNPIPLACGMGVAVDCADPSDPVGSCPAELTHPICEHVVSAPIVDLYQCAQICSP